jgi:hypothetical protein
MSCSGQTGPKAYGHNLTLCSEAPDVQSYDPLLRRDLQEGKRRQ